MSMIYSHPFSYAHTAPQTTFGTPKLVHPDQENIGKGVSLFQKHGYTSPPVCRSDYAMEYPCHGVKKTFKQLIHGASASRIFEEHEITKTINVTKDITSPVDGFALDSFVAVSGTDTLLFQSGQQMTSKKYGDCHIKDIAMFGKTLMIAKEMESSTDVAFLNLSSGTEMEAHNFSIESNPGCSCLCKVELGKVAVAASRRFEGSYPLIIRDLRSGKRQFNPILDHTQPITSMTSPQMGQILTGCEDHVVRLFDINKQISVFSFEHHRDIVTGVANLGSSHAVSVSLDKTASLIDLEQKKVVTTKPHKLPIHAVSTIFDEQKQQAVIATATEGGTVTIFNADFSQEILSFKTPDITSISSLQFLPDGKLTMNASGCNNYLFDSK